VGEYAFYTHPLFIQIIFFKGNDMKKIIAIIALLCISATSFADVNSGSEARSNQTQSAGVAVGGEGRGAGLGNDNSVNNVAASDMSKAVGFAAAPALTTTLTETCMGSTSVGGGFSGGSFSFGTTWRDSACVRRLDAREIKTFGDVQAAKEIMCDSDLVREAFKRVGRPCAEDGGIYTVAAPAPAPAPVVEAPAVEQAPATDAVVRDDQDEVAKRTQEILNQLEQAQASRTY
jgi:hypothetical protein